MSTFKVQIKREGELPGPNVPGSSGGMEDYKVKVIEKFQKCLYRQVDEDVRMQEFESNGGVLLNSKYEYYMPKSVQPVFRQQ